MGPRLLVLAPNRTLCAQVEAVANTIIRNGSLPLSCSSNNGNGHNSQHSERTNGRNRKAGAGVLVCTPRSLLPPNNTPPLGQLECIVLDEGDLLLRDGYVKDVALLLDKTRVNITAYCSCCVAQDSGSVPFPRSNFALLCGAKRSSTRRVRSRSWL